MSNSTPLFVRSDGSGAVTFTVSRVEGVEEMNRPFHFELTLAAATAVDSAEVINKAFTLTLKQGALSTQDVSGIVSDLRVVSDNSANGSIFYRATLVPKHWLLGLNHRSRVFQNVRVDGLIYALLCDITSLSSDEYDYTNGLTQEETINEGTDEEETVCRYAWREFTAQYQESDLDFLHRILEAEGIYYFFKGNVLFFADERANEGTTAANITYYPVNNIPSSETYISSFELSHRIVPNQVHVRDFDYGAFESAAEKTKNTDPAASADAGPSAADRFGTYSEHGRYAKNKKGFVKSAGSDSDAEEAATPPNPDRDYQVERTAQVRAQEVECRRKVLTGASTEPKFRPGYPICLLDSAGGPLNGREYLITRVTHTYDGTDYTNTFEAIPGDVQYRPPRRTPVPRVSGIMTARVKGVAPNKPDAAGDADVNEPFIDAEGRYRVKFPYEDDPDGVEVGADDDPGSDASPPIRLAQPYAGEDYGMHFPSMVGTEMVFACIDGDPDRPIGLGMVPTPRYHTPVPNASLDLKTQNPWADAITGSNEGYNVSGDFFFDPKKNVIRSKLGHQIVMDDNNGGSNVGITIQTGKKDNSVGKNVYWFSRIDMGGYRVKSGVEQVIDGITEVVGYLTTLISRELTQFSSLAFSIGASAAEAGDYLADTYGNTTPVGVAVRSDQAVSLNGAKGINIVSPNLFGQFSGGFVGDDATQKQNQHYVELIAKTLNSVFFQDLISDSIDEYKEYHERVEDNVKHPKKAAFFKWKKNVKKQRLNAAVYTLLQRSGVNISSAGELKMSSLQSTSVIAGMGGMVLKSLGNMEQKAGKGIDIESEQGISISTKGRKFTGKSSIERGLEVVGEVFPPLVTMIKGAMGATDDDPEVKHYPLSIRNESGDVTVRTGDDDGEGAGDVFLSADGTGNMKAFAHDGQVYLWSQKKGTEGGIVLEVGKREDADENKRLKPDVFDSRIQQKDKDVDVFARETLRLQTTDWSSSQSYIKIDKDNQIELKCGQSSLILKKDGTITLKGQKINLEATQDLAVKGMNVKVDANQDVAVKAGMAVSTEGVFNDVKGTMVSLEGDMNTVKGSLVKIGS